MCHNCRSSRDRAVRKIIFVIIWILFMKYELNALTDFMDFIPSCCRTQIVAQKYFLESAYMCKSLGDAEL